jgi:hypothetical protein
MVSNLGRVKGVKGGILRHARMRDRHVVSIYPVPGQLRVRYVHHLVLEAFVGPRPGKMQGCHNDGNPDNNSLSNLRWDTPKGNQSDRVKHGTDTRGERNAHSKLTEDDVRAIRETYARAVPGRDCRGLANKYGVSYPLVALIVKRKAWRHVA